MSAGAYGARNYGCSQRKKIYIRPFKNVKN
jgi:hypothetical protein